MKWENVSVFISSTFQDMHGERDYLVKEVFLGDHQGGQHQPQYGRRLSSQYRQVPAFLYMLSRAEEGLGPRQ